MIKFFDVSFSYPGREPLFVQQSFRLARGSFSVVCGPSGAGKTTLLLLCLGAYRPTQGKVLVMGQAVHELPAGSLARVRRHMGMVFQDFRLLNHRSVFENVAMVPESLGLPRHRAIHDTDAILHRLGLSSVARELPASLSGGQQQRVALARALVHEPLLVLADEPLANLDEAMAGEVLAILNELHHKGATVVLATHDMGLAPRLGCNAVTLMPPGDAQAVGGSS